MYKSINLVVGRRALLSNSLVCRVGGEKRQHLSTTRYEPVFELSKYDVEYRKSIEQPEKYWHERQNLITWFKEPKVVLDKSNSPFEKWHDIEKILLFMNRFRYVFS